MKSYLTIAILMFVCAVSAFAKDKDHQTRMGLLKVVAVGVTIQTGGYRLGATEWVLRYRLRG